MKDEEQVWVGKIKVIDYILVKRWELQMNIDMRDISL